MIEAQRREALRVVGSEPEASDVPAVPGNETLAIDVKGASLHYPFGSFNRASLKTTLLSLFGHKDRGPKATYVDAVRNIDLQIRNGERVALIGHNGSGKSTLLRALAGIYPLASGEISVMGRIETLLELGLGFELEATGRENIYYRGMTMGYSRAQIRKFEAEVVEFAGLGDFIDLPMRTYSAGMYVRLGFAISTQILPDILLVDEVFGAGDASFSKRARERMMGIVKHAGIFVIATHDVNLIKQICSRVVWLDRGEIARDGAPEHVLPDYMAYMAGSN